MRILVLSLALVMPSAGYAEVIQIPIGSQGEAISGLPHQGQSQREVLERFGLPDEERPAVGQPPITRWDYRSFSVYFEHNHVINSVLHHQPRHLAKD